MRQFILVIISSALVMVSAIGPPHHGPNPYYNRRQLPPPPKYYYGHKNGFNGGPPPGPVNKYRQPGSGHVRGTRNPQIPVYPGVPPQGYENQQGPRIPQGPPIHKGPTNLHHLNAQYQTVSLPQQTPPFQTVPPKRFTVAPPQVQKSTVPVFTSATAPWKTQPSHLNSIKNYTPTSNINNVPKSHYHNIKPDEDRSPIHTIPAPNLSLLDKPADFDYKVRQSASAQYQVTPGFKTLDKSVINQVKINPNAFFLQQQATKSFAQDLDPNVPHLKVQQTIDPYSQPPNGKVPLDFYLQEQLDNEIAKQEALLIQQKALEAQQYQQQKALEAQQYQQQKALEAQQYQQQIEAQLELQEQQALLAQQQQQEQIYQQQALQAQQQLALQAQQNIALQAQQQASYQQYQQVPQGSSETLTADELYSLMNGIPPNNQQRAQPSVVASQEILFTPQQHQDVISATTNFQPNFQSFNYNEKQHQEQVQQEIQQQKQAQQQQQQKQVQQQQQQQQQQSIQQQFQATQQNQKRQQPSSSQETVTTARTGELKQSFSPQYQDFNYNEKTKRNGFNNENIAQVTSQVTFENLPKAEVSRPNTEKRENKKERRYHKHSFPQNQGYTTSYSTLPKELTENQNGNIPQQSSYPTQAVSYNDKQNSKRVKTSYSVSGEHKKQNSNVLKKKNKYYTTNGYSTIADDLLQQNNFNNDVQQLTYSTLPNEKIVQMLKNHREANVTQQYGQQNQNKVQEKDELQRMRENAQKFYNPHILQAVRNSTQMNSGSDNVQIQQSVQIYETSYPSQSNDNHIDLSGLTTPSPNIETASSAPSSTTFRSTTPEPVTVTEINVVESTGDSDHQESNIFEEIMLQDETKPLEDSYHSNSHSYFGQRIRPKRT